MDMFGNQIVICFTGRNFSDDLKNDADEKQDCVLRERGRGFNPFELFK